MLCQLNTINKTLDSVNVYFVSEKTLYSNFNTFSKIAKTIGQIRYKNTYKYQTTLRLVY